MFQTYKSQISERHFLHGPLLVLLIAFAGSCCLKKSEMSKADHSSATGESATAPMAGIERDAGNPSRGVDEESCVDQWLAARKLDSYGAPKGTMYIGGTPLFDESTGKTTPRLEHVYARRPEAKKACRPTQP